MERDLISERIECYYQQYVSQQSEILFNKATNTLMQKVEDIPYCRKVLNDIMEKYSFAPESMEELCDYPYSYIVQYINNEEQYISLCMHYFRYIQELKLTRPPLKPYECGWLAGSTKTKTEMIQLFKTDFIRPILDFLLLKLKEESYILHILDRYKLRVEYFKNIRESIEQEIKKESISDKIKELQLQQKIYLFLFEQGIECCYSPKVGNGEIDFLLPQCNKKPFIVETKIYNGNDSYIKQGISQLQIYMERVKTPYGCLVVFTEKDVVFKMTNIPSNINIITIYIGDKTPSQRKTKPIDLSSK